MALVLLTYTAKLAVSARPAARSKIVGTRVPGGDFIGSLSEPLGYFFYFNEFPTYRLWFASSDS